VRRPVGQVTDALEANELAVAAGAFRDTLDAVTNWYVRRSRDRFWAAETPEGQQAVDTLHTALEVLCRLGAPLLPLVGEEIWRGLTGGRSVHLTDWPLADELPADDALVAAMDTVREVASVALSLRKAASIRVRQPLQQLTVVLPEPEAVERLVDLLRDELNVHDVRLLSVERAHEVGVEVEQRLQVNARAAGPRLGRSVQQVIGAARAGEWSVDETGSLVCGGVGLEAGEFELTTVVRGAGEHDAVAPLGAGGFVMLDTTVTDALESEGWARDVVRQVQDARREAGLHVSDRIALRLTVAADRAAAAAVHRGLVAAETLAVELAVEVGEVGRDGAGVALEKA
jgi:isoleucyl-tRNA synthetase